MDDNNHILSLLEPKLWKTLNNLPTYSSDKVLSQSQELKNLNYPHHIVAALLTQSKLRLKAHKKFGPLADSMLFTTHGLEQATRLKIAQYHATRFQQNNIKHIADLGCGIGADSIAFSQKNIRTTSIEKDTITAKIAAKNLSKFPNTKVITGDITQITLPKVDALWLDPARRTINTQGAKKIFDPEQYSPPFSFIYELSKKFPLGVKISPIIPHNFLPENTETQWISDNNEVVEATIWFGKLARKNICRSALIIKDGNEYEISSPQNYETSPKPEIAAIKKYLYEPNKAVIRAGLVAEIAKKIDGYLIHPEIAYLSCNKKIDSPFATGYEVLETLPYSIKILNKYLQKNSIGNVEIKKRGINITPESLRKKLKLFGKEKTTIIVTRNQKGHQIIIANKLSSQP